MIKLPETNGLTKIYDEPIYIEEKINNIPFNYYKVTGQLDSVYCMGTVVHLDSDVCFCHIAKFRIIPDFFY